MEIINEAVCVLETDTLDTELIQLLETRYVVIVEAVGSKIRITLQ